MLDDMTPREEIEHTAIDSLYFISNLLSTTEDPKKVLGLILQEIVHVLSPTSALIALIAADTKKLELEVSHGLPGPQDAPPSIQLEKGVSGWTALHGRPLIVADVRKESRYLPLHSEIRSEIALPMKEHDNVIGVIYVGSSQPDAFDSHALRTLTLMTQEASRVISRLWLIRRLRAKANQLESLVNLSRRISSELDAETILHSLAFEGRALMNCDACALFLLHPDESTLHVHSMVTRQGTLEVDVTIALEDSALSTLIHRQKQIEITDLAFTEENAFRRIIRREGLSSMLSSPIIFNDQIIGVLNAYTCDRHRFNNDEKKALHTLAGLGAIAIQNARLYSRIFHTEAALRRNERLTHLGMLAAEIAHEIRNPLTVIKLLFEALDLRFPESDARYTDAKIIREKLNHLETIVERVLNFGHQRAEINALCDLNQLVDETLHLVRLKLHQQKVMISYHPQPDRLPVEVNKGQIQQVILNLILNATEAMPDGGKIHIETTMNEDGQSHFLIRDSGTGIPESIRASIFDSFLTHRADGTGLGLSISKRILRAHRGDLELVTSSATGTTFRFRLPAASSELTDAN